MDAKQEGTLEQALVTRISKTELARWTAEQALRYQELMRYARCAMKAVEAQAQIVGEDFALQYGGDPIEAVRSRLMAPEDVADSILAGGFPLTVESIERNVPDLARVFVTATFAADLYRLADALKRRDGMSLVRTEDYIARPKESGYRGLHLVLSVPVELRGRCRMMTVETVLRTAAMELWANAEQKFRKRADVFLPEQVTREMQACAALSAEWDQRLEQIRYNVEHRVITK